MVPNWPNVTDRLKLPSDAESLKKHVSDKSVHALLLEEIAKNCEDQKHYAIPRHVIVAPTAFTVENSMATPKMSLRRKQIYAAFEKKIAEIAK